jgi:hypothetical protein
LAVERARRGSDTLSTHALMRGGVLQLHRLGLLDSARRSGVLAVAFATALRGEAALLSGDLTLAETELTEAAELHHDIGSTAGEAYSLQRLSEVRLAQGNRAEAQQLLRRALPLAR